MGFETFKPLTGEEKEKTKSRIISDANLIEGGAEIRDDGSIEVTKNQIKDAKQEMESEQGHYLEQASVNGIDFSVGWDNGYRDYTIYFPQIEIGEKAYEQNVPDQVIRISKNREKAKKVFDFIKQEAQQEGDVYKLYKKAENFIHNLWEDDEE